MPFPMVPLIFACDRNLTSKTPNCHFWGIQIFSFSRRKQRNLERQRFFIFSYGRVLKELSIDAKKSTIRASQKEDTAQKRKCRFLFFALNSRRGSNFFLILIPFDRPFQDLSTHYKIVMTWVVDWPEIRKTLFWWSFDKKSARNIFQSAPKTIK